MSEKFDLVVLGSGTAASSIAQQCRAANWRVAVVDRRPFGGTCALRGCTPKKVLAHAAAVIDAANRMRGKGINARQLGIAWPSLMDFKRSFTDQVPANTEQAFARQGIGCYHGAARFVGPHTVQVAGEKLESRYIVIATGAEPVRLPIGGFKHLASSDDFLELEQLPERILFVGGGYIAFEFAHIAARAGTSAAILHQGSRPLEGFDPDIVALLVERTRRLGVNIHVGHKVTEIEKSGVRYAVRTRSNGRDAQFKTELAVHSAGRQPALEDLDLDVGGIEVDSERIKLDDHLRSISNESVYAAGDAAQQGPPLTPVATLDAQVVTSNLLAGSNSKPNYSGVPSVVFTTPPLARVGLSEQQARDQARELHVKSETTANWFTARHTGESCSGFKTLVDNANGRILGAHIVGPGAEEIVNLFALAIQNGLSATQLKQGALAFPTAGYDVRSML